MSFERKQQNIVTKTGISWLDILEKEFDKSFVSIDLTLTKLYDNSNISLVNDIKQNLTNLSSIFTQITHKSLTVFENNSLLDERVNDLRKDLVQVKCDKDLLDKQLIDRNEQLNAIANTYNSKRGNEYSFRCNLLECSNSKLCNSYSSNNNNNVNSECEKKHQFHELQEIRKENHLLRKRLLNLESELFGAKLAAKYLDKELSGRIQQIQLLGKSNLRSEDQDRLWNQLEAEIHLHRHKTVVKACRGRNLALGLKVDSPEHCEEIKDDEIGGQKSKSVGKRKQGIGELREVYVDRGDTNEPIGISITGGKEHGIPILISEIHPNTPASRCGKLYIGDAILTINKIDLQGLKHSDAAQILCDQKGKCLLQVVFVAPEDCDEQQNESTESCSESQEIYPFFDDNLIPNIIDSFEKLNETEFEPECKTEVNDEDYDNLSSITDTMSSPSKYPGVAKLCTSEQTTWIKSTNDEQFIPYKSKETLIN